MLDRILLFPYYLSLKIRDRLYTGGTIESSVADVPTVCIGGITVGGTGKTPFTEMVLRMLDRSPRWKDSNKAVLSRGYRRKSKGFQLVSDTGLSSSFGDEPLQMKRKFPDVNVAVCRDRALGCDCLCHPEKNLVTAKAGIPPADIIVLDDAYQARELRASLNVVLVDYGRPVTEDMLLPFGRLRDLYERMYDADIVVVTKCPSDLRESERNDFAKVLEYKDYSYPSPDVTAPNGKRQQLLFATVEYQPFEPFMPGSDSRYLYSKRVVMFSGIAGDTNLYRHLSDRYNIVRRLAFPDHHPYTRSDIDKIIKPLQDDPTVWAVTTEKDVQRLLDIPEIEEPLRSRLFYAPISMRFIDSSEEAVFSERLLKL